MKFIFWATLMSDGISLRLSTIKNCVAKKKNSAFSLKSVTNLFSWKNSGIQGIFLLLWKDFSTDHGTRRWIH